MTSTNRGGRSIFREGRRRRDAAAVVVAALVLLPASPMAATQGPAAAYSVLLNFGGLDGSRPDSGVIADAAGNLYGTTFQGGAFGYGAVYEVLATGGETVLYSFTGGSDGALPYASLIRDAAGNLYGTAGQGGTFNNACPNGCGVVFRLTPKGKETVLYSFTGGSDGNEPVSNLVRDAAGNLYGTTVAGGSGITTTCAGFSSPGCGVVFKVTKAGIESVLYSFTGASDGAAPAFGLMRDSAGNLYGTASLGGDVSSCAGFGCGVVYKLDTSGNETVLYSFSGGADGWGPLWGLTSDAEGNLYGTTPMGGDFSCGTGYGCGVVFKIDSAGNETVLHTFGGADGESPAGALVRDPQGNLYGMTAQGGADNFGAIFKLSSSGKESLLHSFTGADGALPQSALLPYKGSLYGTTYEGGSLDGGNGVVFKVVP